LWVAASGLSTTARLFYQRVSALLDAHFSRHPQVQAAMSASLGNYVDRGNHSQYLE
jgi:hypothetical protein